ncbi:MAG: rRNA maturation RNase YbeY [Ignavibacteria bacterium]|nr:rRNA maturation RNase YbeY [Ignavibacteria bacterium]
MKNIFVNCEIKCSVIKRNVHRIVGLIKNIHQLNFNSLEINFVSKGTIEKINKIYLGHNYATDVISFNYSNESNNLDGEIFICIDIAVENAKFYNVTPDNELKRLVIHGILHLIGFRDNTNKQKFEMSKEENFILQKIPRPIKII